MTLATITNGENIYIQSHEGDSILYPFEFDECLFNCITGAPRLHSYDNYQILLNHIRRANLDAFWSRAKDTV